MPDQEHQKKEKNTGSHMLIDTFVKKDDSDSDSSFDDDDNGNPDDIYDLTFF